MPNIVRIIKSRRMRWTRHIACTKEVSAYKILAGKSEEKRPLGIPKCRRKDNIRMDPKLIGWGGVGWMNLAQDRDHWRVLLRKVMNFRVQ
jgi:hypothetical protein